MIIPYSSDEENDKNIDGNKDVIFHYKNGKTEASNLPADNVEKNNHFASDVKV